MAKRNAKEIIERTPEEAFWLEYPDAPYLLKVGDIFLLASSQRQAIDLARMAGTTPEKIHNPNLKTSTEDAS